jgi:hypothetical protein
MASTSNASYNRADPAFPIEDFAPKIIWSIWFQGEVAAPIVATRCFESWRTKNPGWELRVLDSAEVLNLLPDLKPLMERGDMTWTGKSNLVRLNLLNRFGGVWVDATCYCTLALDEWLPKHMDAGFFAFQRTDQLMLSSWFLAAHSDNYIIKKWLAALNNYWSVTFKRSQESGPHRVTCGATPLADRLESFRVRHKLPTSLWFSFPLRRILRIYPYSSTHYMFEAIYNKDTKFRENWDSVPKLHADIPHELQHFGLFRKDFDEAWLNRITKTAPHPLHKLTWKHNEAELTNDCLLNRLLETLLK